MSSCPPTSVSTHSASASVTDAQQAEGKSPSVTRFFPTIARMLLGLPLCLFGLNGFLNFIPQPTTPLPERAMAFAAALANSGYMLPLIAVTLLSVGVLLVTNRFVPLALALFAPFVVNSVAFHVFLERSGLVMSLLFLGLELYLAWAYRKAFAPMLAARVRTA